MGHITYSLISLIGVKAGRFNLLFVIRPNLSVAIKNPCRGLIHRDTMEKLTIITPLLNRS